MFASQLLRILQTIPSDMKYETRVFDPAEQNMTMKKNQNATFYDSKSFGKEAECLAFESKEICLLNGSRTGNAPSAFGVNGRNEHWNAKFMNDFSKDTESRARDSPRKEDQNGLLYHLSHQDVESDSLYSETKDEDKLWRSPEFECLTMVKETTQCNEDEFQDSGHLSISASDLIETDSNMFSDKNTVEFELPELIVCYKETNYHIVKDVRGDERMPVEENILFKNGNDDQTCISFSQPPSGNSHCKATEEGVGMEIFISDGLTTSSLENMKGVGAHEYGSKEETNGKLFAQGGPKSPSESSLAKDTAKDCNSDLMQTVEANSSITGKIVTDASKEESFVVSTLPIQEFGTRSFLRSFLNSLDIDGNKTVPRNEIPSGKAVYESSAEAEPKEDVQAKNILYNSKVESRSITFNFSSSVAVAAGNSNGITENVKQQAVELADVLEHKNANAGNLSDNRQVQCTSMKGNKTENVHGKFSATSQVQCCSSTDRCHDNGHEQSPDHKDVSSDDLSADDQDQFANSKSQGSANNDGPVVEPYFPKHKRGNSSGNVSVISQMQYDEGESSFSAAGLVTYSGSIAYSGSLSLRSDGSATSTRSFAFPILQSEWNRSPVRMEKADRRHFPKHKNWRSGLLCCRF